MQVAIFLWILYRNSYWVRHCAAKGEDRTGFGICLSVLCAQVAQSTERQIPDPDPSSPFAVRRQSQ